MTSDPDCLFCKIVAREAPAQIVWESEQALALRDVDPQAPTHLLVIPKAHHRDIGALVADDPQAVVGLLQGVSAVAEQEGVGGGHRLVFNTGGEAGQSVFHCHGHVLGGRALTWPPG